MPLMEIMVGISGFIIAIYALYCGLGLWMSQQVQQIARGEEPMRDDDGLTILDHMPKAHIEIMKHYYLGPRGVLSRLGFLSLIASLGALMANSDLSVYLFGLGLGIDCALFISYENQKSFLAQTTPSERLFDFFQYSMLLAAFAILVWHQYYN